MINNWRRLNPEPVPFLRLGFLVYRVTVDWSPMMRRWPLGRLVSWFRIWTRRPMRLSVMRRSQSMCAPSMMMLFSTSALRMVEPSPMLV